MKTTFRGVSEKMLSLECDLIVFGGDLNLVFVVEKDKKAALPLHIGIQKKRSLL